MERNMAFEVENIIENIDFSMKMEDLPLTKEDKDRLNACLTGEYDINVILQKL
jgi:hypothetical protein